MATPRREVAQGELSYTHRLPERVNGRWPSHAWPGGYPIVYVTKDCGNLCPTCANDNIQLTLTGDDQWRIMASFINYEAGDDNHCDNCGKELEVAYPAD